MKHENKISGHLKIEVEVVLVLYIEEGEIDCSYKLLFYNFSFSFNLLFLSIFPQIQLLFNIFCRYNYNMLLALQFEPFPPLTSKHFVHKKVTIQLHDSQQLLLNSLFLKTVFFPNPLFLKCDTWPLNKFPIDIIACKFERQKTKVRMLFFKSCN